MQRLLVNTMLAPVLQECLPGTRQALMQHQPSTSRQLLETDQEIWFGIIHGPQRVLQPLSTIRLAMGSDVKSNQSQKLDLLK